MFPFPAHQTGRAQLEHPAFRLVSPQRPRKRSDNTAPCDGTPVTLPSRCGNSWMGNIRNHSGFQTFVNDRSVALSPAHQKQGPFPPPTLLGLHGCMTLSDFRAGYHPIDDVWRGDLQSRTGFLPSEQHNVTIEERRQSNGCRERRLEAELYDSRCGSVASADQVQLPAGDSCD